MSRILRFILITLVSSPACAAQALENTVRLPVPATDGTVSVEEAMQERRSIRSFDPDATMNLDGVSQILWAAQGITSGSRLRTAPSAGAVYPFSIYLVAERVGSLPSGIYRYSPGEHQLELVIEGEFLTDIATASLNQRWIGSASILVAMVADYSVITDAYGNRGIMYTHMEAGHISQNIYLQCVSLGLGTCAVGAFDESAIAGILMLPDNETALYLMPVGTPY
jgi:SagB-type dehydrogenase family enzyme